MDEFVAPLQYWEVMKAEEDKRNAEYQALIDQLTTENYVDGRIHQ